MFFGVLEVGEMRIGFFLVIMSLNELVIFRVFVVEEKLKMLYVQRIGNGFDFFGDLIKGVKQRLGFEVNCGISKYFSKWWK